MGNPLINELLVGIGSKDRFSMDQPKNDSQFADFFLDPPIVRIVEALYGGALTVPARPAERPAAARDLRRRPSRRRARPPAPSPTCCASTPACPPTPPATASRLGLLGGDAAGFPNGRRLFDDVTDITLRVGVGGVLAAPFPGFNAGVNGRLGDGVNVDDAAYHAAFPYIGSAPDGRNRRHVDPGRAGRRPHSLKLASAGRRPRWRPTAASRRLSVEES